MWETQQSCGKREQVSAAAHDFAELALLLLVAVKRWEEDVHGQPAL